METEIYLDNDNDPEGDTRLLQHVELPVQIAYAFGFNFPIYIKVGFIRRLMWRILGIHIVKVKR